MSTWEDAQDVVADGPHLAPPLALATFVRCFCKWFLTACIARVATHAGCGCKAMTARVKQAAVIAGGTAPCDPCRGASKSSDRACFSVLPY